MPAALSLSCPARYPGTWHVDQVGVKAPGRPTTMVFLPARREVVFTYFTDRSMERGDQTGVARCRRGEGRRTGLDDDFRFLIVLFPVPGRDRIGWEGSVQTMRTLKSGGNWSWRFASGNLSPTPTILPDCLSTVETLK